MALVDKFRRVNQLSFDPTQIPLDYPSDAAALDVGLGLGAGEALIRRCIKCYVYRSCLRPFLLVIQYL